MGAGAQPLGERGILRQVVAELASGEAAPIFSLHGRAGFDVPVVDALLHEEQTGGGFDAKLVRGHV